MITIQNQNINKNDVSNEIQLDYTNEVFNEARMIFFEKAELRNKVIPVMKKNGEILFYLKWNPNQVDECYYADDFWNYNIYDLNLDYELLDRGESYLFLTLEEYTYQIARIIQEKYPEKQVFFMDENAHLFFKETSFLHIIHSLADLYNNYKMCISKTILTIDSKREFLHNDMRFIIKRYRSLSVMTSLFWKSKIVCFGSKNPNKTFYLIKDYLGFSGLADMIKHAFLKIAMIEHKVQEDITVLVDFSNTSDRNQFTGGNGENAWTLYFEQISDIPLEEVYESKNVIISSQKGWDLFNPYIYEEHCFINWQDMIHRYLRINAATQKYIENLYEKTILYKNARILGVIGRGSDRWSERGRTKKPMDISRFLEEVGKAMIDWKCDYVFLATEDQLVYDAFMESTLRDSVISVDQDRIDYKDERNHNLLLAEIKIRDHKDGYYDNLRYLGILYILSKCTSLISTCYCGASWCAIGLNNGRYENVKVF